MDNVSFTFDTFKRDISKNGYPENFIDRCFRLFINRMKENVPAVEKKPLGLVRLFWGNYHCILELNYKTPSSEYLAAGYFQLYNFPFKVSATDI